jgi:hypothetical protein
MKKSIKKITKEDLQKIPLDRVMKDMEIVGDLVNKISNFKIDEKLEESDAEKLKTELKEVETYLKGQYGHYMDENLDLDNIDNLD